MSHTQVEAITRTRTVINVKYLGNQVLLLFYQLFIRHLLRHWTICPWGGEADVDIGSSIKTNRIVGYVAVVLLQAANLPLL